jgi:hypothetical protein
VQVAEDLSSHIDLKYVCCEELGVHMNFSQIPVEIAYRKTVTHLDELRSASTKVSDLLEKVNEQEWKNYVTYRNTHSVLLASIISAILIYLLFKLYTYTSRRMPTWFGRNEVTKSPPDNCHTVRQGNAENTCSTSGEVNLQVANPPSPSPIKAATTRVAPSHY